jgi:hypothetical protein
VIERGGAGRSWADIVGSQNLSQGAVPLPHAQFGATIACKNNETLHILVIFFTCVPPSPH